MRVTLLPFVALLSTAALGAQRFASSIDCLTEEATCAAALEAVRAAAKAEKWTLVEEAPLRLHVVVKKHIAFFELRDAQGVRVISHTDLTHYREPHRSVDGLLFLSAFTVAAIPLVVELSPPTTLADMAAAWTGMTRQLLRKGPQRWHGPSELRGRRWTLAVGTPRVLRRADLEEGMILDGDDDFQEVAPETDEALEADYSARLVLADLVQFLDQHHQKIKRGDGKATLVIQSVNGRFLTYLGVRDNQALVQSLPFTAKAIPPRSPSFPLKGATRMLVPITLRPR